MTAGDPAGDPPSRGDRRAAPTGSTLGRLLDGLGWWRVLRRGGVGRVMSVLSFIDALGSALFGAVIAVLLVRAVHLSPGDIGLGLSIGGLAGVVAAVPAGAVADRIGAQRFVVWASALCAVAFAFYPVVDSFTGLVVAASAVSVTIAGIWPAQQAYLGELLSADQRVEILASTRAIRNLGYALGGVLAAVALVFPGRLTLVICAEANALTFVISALAVVRLPARERTSRERERSAWSLAPFRDGLYVSLTLASVLYALSLAFLDIGIPLWITVQTSAPPALAGVAITVNTVLVVLMQVRVSKHADGLGACRRALSVSAVAFAAFAVLMIVSNVGSSVLAAVVLVLAAVALTVGEMFESAAWWTVSYELADPHRRTQYLSLFSLNINVVFAVGPALMALVVQSAYVGWTVLAGLYVVVAAGIGPLINRGAGRWPVAESLPVEGRTA